MKQAEAQIKKLVENSTKPQVMKNTRYMEEEEGRQPEYVGGGVIILCRFALYCHFLCSWPRVRGKGKHAT